MISARWFLAASLVFWLFAGNLINQRVSYSAPTMARPVISSAELKRTAKETIIVPNIGNFQPGTLTVSASLMLAKKAKAGSWKLTGKSKEHSRLSG